MFNNQPSYTLTKNTTLLWDFWRQIFLIKGRKKAMLQLRSVLNAFKFNLEIYMCDRVVVNLLNNEKKERESAFLWIYRIEGGWFRRWKK